MLHEWQAKALERVLCSDIPPHRLIRPLEDPMKSLLFVSATSGGKSLVSEILLLRELLLAGRRAICVYPTVAICDQKLQAFRRKFMHPSSYLSLQVHGFYGSSDSCVWSPKVDIAVCTAERANMILNRLLMDSPLPVKTFLQRDEPIDIQAENRQVSGDIQTEMMRHIKDSVSKYGALAHPIEAIGTVVVDEIHELSDPSRGYILEALLAKLIAIRRIQSLREKRPPRVVALSGTLSNSAQLASWLESDEYVSMTRPQQLHFHVLYRRKLVRMGDERDTATHLCDPHVTATLTYEEAQSFTSCSNVTLANTTSSATPCAAVQDVRVSDPDGLGYLVFQFWRKNAAAIFSPAAQLEDPPLQPLTEDVDQMPRRDGGGIIIFCQSRVWTENIVNFLVTVLPIYAANVHGTARPRMTWQRQRLIDELTEEFSPEVVPETLKAGIRLGIAFHHAGLSGSERRRLEQAFCRGDLSVLVATSTLAAGVNLPVKTVIIRSVEIGREAQLLQMAGRAGRGVKVDESKPPLSRIQTDLNDVEVRYDEREELLRTAPSLDPKQMRRKGRLQNIQEACTDPLEEGLDIEISTCASSNECSLAQADGKIDRDDRTFASSNEVKPLQASRIAEREGGLVFCMCKNDREISRACLDLTVLEPNCTVSELVQIANRYLFKHLEHRDVYVSLRTLELLRCVALHQPPQSLALRPDSREPYGARERNARAQTRLCGSWAGSLITSPLVLCTFFHQTDKALAEKDIRTFTELSCYYKSCFGTLPLPGLNNGCATFAQWLVTPIHTCQKKEKLVDDEQRVKADVIKDRRQLTETGNQDTNKVDCDQCWLDESTIYLTPLGRAIIDSNLKLSAAIEIAVSMVTLLWRKLKVKESSEEGRSGSIIVPFIHLLAVALPGDIFPKTPPWHSAVSFLTSATVCCETSGSSSGDAALLSEIRQAALSAGGPLSVSVELFAHFARIEMAVPDVDKVLPMQGFRECRVIWNHARVFAAIIIADASLCTECSDMSLATSYGISVPVLRMMRKQASMSLSIASTFAAVLQLPEIAVLMKMFVRKVSAGRGDQVEDTNLLHLQQLPSLKGRFSHVLFAAGFTSIADIADANLLAIEHALESGEVFNFADRGSEMSGDKKCGDRTNVAQRILHEAQSFCKKFHPVGKKDVQASRDEAAEEESDDSMSELDEGSDFPISDTD